MDSTLRAVSGVRSVSGVGVVQLVVHGEQRCSIAALCAVVICGAAQNAEFGTTIQVTARDAHGTSAAMPAFCLLIVIRPSMIACWEREKRDGDEES